jgi:endonuclease III
MLCLTAGKIYYIYQYHTCVHDNDASLRNISKHVQETYVNPHSIDILIKKLEQRAKNLPPPMITLIKQEFGPDPFIILISCLLSLRTRDQVTYPVCRALLSRARTPQQILAIPLSELTRLLHPLGFYRRKARLLHDVSKEIITRFGGKVPSSKEELLSIKGVGLKTANLVLAEAFGIPAICVDTHVHTIANRLGLVHTKTPEQTEAALRAIIPKKYWIKINRLLVVWGQNPCKTPETCPVHELCQKIYVKKRKKPNKKA